MCLIKNNNYFKSNLNNKIYIRLEIAFICDIICLDNLSSLENSPAFSDPTETIIAPVNVAKSFIN